MTKFNDIIWDEPEDRVVMITLNRPEVRNAVGLQMAADVIEAARRINERHEIRAVVLTGADKA